MGNEKQKSNYEESKNLCLFIKHKFFSPFKIDGRDTSLNKYASACNLSPSTISRINKAEGNNMQMNTLFELCKFEKCSPQALVREFEIR